MTDFFTLAFTFFILMNSFATIPICVSLLKDLSSKRQYFVIVREMLIALIVFFLFYLLGDLLLDLLSTSQNAISISGGIILFLIALKMIFSPTKIETTEVEQEPFIVPLAVPLIAGPAMLAAIIIYSHKEFSKTTFLSALLLAWLISLFVLLCSPFIKKVLGKRGLRACESLMGFVLTLISFEMLLNGLHCFIRDLHC